MRYLAPIQYAIEFQRRRHLKVLKYVKYGDGFYENGCIETKKEGVSWTYDTPLFL